VASSAKHASRTRATATNAGQQGATEAGWQRSQIGQGRQGFHNPVSYVSEAAEASEVQGTGAWQGSMAAGGGSRVTRPNTLYFQS
jgi:hypothetical protein